MATAMSPSRASSGCPSTSVLDRLIAAAEGHQLATHPTGHALRRRGCCLQGDSLERESDAEVPHMGHQRARLSAVDRYAEVLPIKRAQEAIEDPEPTFLEACLEHWGVIRRIRGLGLPRSSLLIRVQKFLDARVCAFKVAGPTNCADLPA